ncbi:MAG: ATP-binding protein [Anaerolineae bacterium]
MVIIEHERVTYANIAAARLLQASSPEVLHGLHLAELLEPRSFEAAHRAIAEVIASRRESDTKELVFTRLDGEPVQLICTAAPLQPGRPESVVLTAMQPPAVYLTQDARIQKILNSITDVVYLIGYDWTYRFANMAASRVTTWNRDDLVGKHVTTVYPNITETRQYTVYRDAMERSEPLVFRTDEPILPGGLTAHYEVRVFPVDEGLLCFAHDITDKLRAEENLRAQRQLALVLRDTAAVLNSTLDLDEVLDRILSNVHRIVPHQMSNIMLVHDDRVSVARIRGYDNHVSALSGQSFAIEEVAHLAMMSNDRAPLLIDDVRQFPGWGNTGLEDELPAYAGTPIVRGCHVIGFLNLRSTEPFQQMHATRLLAFADQAAVALRKAALYESTVERVAELTERNDDLYVFGHAAAHDLRSPLQVDMGMADVLLYEMDADMDDTVRDGLQTILDYAQRMRRISDNLQDLAAIGSQHDNLAPVDLNTIVTTAVETFDHALNERGVRLTVDNNLPTVVGHGPLLEQAVGNLIDNAVKYIGRDNADPAVWIYGRIDGDWARLSVMDNGIGIPEDMREQIFKMGARSHPQEGPGQGLGLTLIKRTIERMGGRVGVDPAPEQGSVFWFMLPLAIADES